MTSPSVVIVGAGVMGASAAYHLARRGVRDIQVLERHARPALGSTGKATGGFRAQFGTKVNVQLSLLSRVKLLQFQDETGVDPGYRPCGYLFLAASREQLDVLARIRAVQREAGLALSRAVDLDEIARLNPAVRLEQVQGGSFCPIDGFLRAADITRGYVEAAQRLGVRFAFDEPVLALETEARPAGTEHTDGAPAGDLRRIIAVRTARRRLPVASVIDAAGAWAGPVAELAGLQVPVRPVRRQVAITVRTDALPEDMPMTAFLSDGFHLRVRDGRVLLLWPDGLTAPEGFDDTFERAWLDGVVQRARERVPCLREVAIDEAGAWAGLYEMSPDHHALLGRAPAAENLWLINGSSGHGVMHAPALGQLLAEQMLDGEALSMDARALRPGRFAEGQPNPGALLL